MRKSFYKTVFLYFYLCLTIMGCATNKNLLFVAPSLLPFTTREMKTPGFWINEHPFPDKVILDEKEIFTFNQDIQNRLKLTKDLSLWPSQYPREELKSSLLSSWNDFKNQKFFTKEGKKANDLFFDTVKSNMNLEEIPSLIDRQYAFVVHYADQRLLPTQEGLYAKAFDVDFDELQNSALDVGTVVVVLHTSADQNWYYVESSMTSGWVSSEKIAFCNKEEVDDFLSQASFIVTTEGKADIFLDPAMTQYYDYVRMGNTFPLMNKTDSFYEIKMSMRQENGHSQMGRGYVAIQKANKGFLSYTPRNIYEQAFKLFNSPYGWGGMYGEQDCSRLLWEVFSTVGIRLPRNSKDQIQVGHILAQFPQEETEEEKLKTINQTAMGAMTLLGMKGHIMLYLGKVNDRPYAIHSVWAYRQPSDGEDKIFVLNRVVVSDLSLGEGSQKGSWLDRIHTVSSVGFSDEE